MRSKHVHRCGDTALVRMPAQPELRVPHPLPPVGSTSSAVDTQCGWLRQVWAVDAVVEAVEHASPVLARRLDAVAAGERPDAKQAQRLMVTMTRYLQRLTTRSTPFGLFAGVTAASFGPSLDVSWRDEHHAFARANGSWLAKVVAQLEAEPQLLERLPVVLNDLRFVRGNRLVVPHQHRPDETSERAGSEVSIRRTAAVQLVEQAARLPITGRDLAGKLLAEFPAVDRARTTRLMADLVRQGVLISCLRAPSTVTDAFGHLTDQLDAVGAASLPQLDGLLAELAAIRADLARHNVAPAPDRRAIRQAVIERMTDLDATARQPVAVDLRLGCSLVLPHRVQCEAETVAANLARLTAFPSGSPTWRDFHARFFERYGIGSLVPVVEVVDPDVGIGLPAGYRGSPAPEPTASLTERDRRLLVLAQRAALDGADEVVLDDAAIDDLAVGGPTSGGPDGARLPVDLELCFQVHAPSASTLEAGVFDLVVRSVSRGAGTMAGRFLDLLDPADRQTMAHAFTGPAEADPDVVRAQLSFPPLVMGTDHVARAPQVLPAVISLGEHPGEASGRVLELADLAVTSNGHRLFLVSRSLCRRVEPSILHALDLRGHTPPIARFLAEVARAHEASVTGFDWGAATALPFLPRLRHGRTVLAPARWRLNPADLPDPGDWRAWLDALRAWRTKRGVPRQVELGAGDRQLRLDLDEDAHCVVLRAHLDRSDLAVLTEAPGPDAFGWLGGRPHEIVTTMTATRPPRRADQVSIAAAPAVRRADGHLPGISPWLYVKLYGHPDRQPEILTEHLPALFAAWDEPPAWWFIRYRDPEPHLRLRIALPADDGDGFGLATRRVSSWAAELRGQGLLRDLSYATYHPETGRWGPGAAMAAAEAVFGDDSRAAIAQLAEPPAAHRQALTAMSLVAIATGFTGSTRAGMRWLIEHAKTEPGPSAPRPVLTAAVRLADPADDWAALRSEPGGTAVAHAWELRRRSLGAYRTEVDRSGFDVDAVLVALLHAHHIRAAGIDVDDERGALRLARAAALSWTARHDRSEP